MTDVEERLTAAGFVKLPPERRPTMAKMWAGPGHRERAREERREVGTMLDRFDRPQPVQQVFVFAKTGDVEIYDTLTALKMLEAQNG